MSNGGTNALGICRNVAICWLYFNVFKEIICCLYIRFICSVL